MHDDSSLPQIQKEWHGSYKAYTIGLILSLLLTGASFFLAWANLISGYTLIVSLVALGLIQAVVQLLFFLHVGTEPSPKWETLVFAFMVAVILIVVIGSLWIMYDLDNRVMPGMHKVL